MEEKPHLPMEQTDVFLRYVAVADELWQLVSSWDKLAKDTVGTQMLRAADSIGANLVEGDGRFAKGDGLHFFTIARASARETRYWIERARTRNLLKPDEATRLIEELERATRMLNAMINYRRTKPAPIVREDAAPYSAPNTQHPTPNT